MINLKNFQSFDKGSKVILISAVVAIISLFFKWVKVEFLDIGASGFDVGAWKCLVVFVYPLFAVITERAINRIAGFVCAGVGVLITIYVYSKTNTIISNMGLGVYIFLASCIALAMGVYFYSQEKPGNGYKTGNSSSAPFSVNPSTVCPNCGKEVRSGSKFCSGCGNEL
jgi:hypothetical protein